MNQNKNLGYVLNKDQQRLVEEKREFATGMARRYAGGSVPTDELESEACFALCYAAYKYKKVEGCKFTTYAYHFIRVRIMRFLKSEGKRMDVEKCQDVEELAGAEITDDEISDADNERRMRLDELMGRLSPRERELVRRSYAIGCEEATVRELAEETGISPERVRQIITKGVNKLMIMYYSLES